MNEIIEAILSDTDLAEAWDDLDWGDYSDYNDAPWDDWADWSDSFPSGPKD
jgi:hypothetical protein